jgi:hypothetical protein
MWYGFLVGATHHTGVLRQLCVAPLPLAFNDTYEDFVLNSSNWLVDDVTDGHTLCSNHTPVLHNAMKELHVSVHVDTTNKGRR